MPKRVTGFVYSQREGDGEKGEGRGCEDSCTVLLHYDNLLATVKCEVISAVEQQLRFVVKGVEGTWRKVSFSCLTLSVQIRKTDREESKILILPTEQSRPPRTTSEDRHEAWRPRLRR